MQKLLSILGFIICLSAPLSLLAQATSAPSAPEARIGSWAIRWVAPEATLREKDLRQRGHELAQTLLAHNVDLWALQGIRTGKAERMVLAAMLKTLQQETQTIWQLKLDSCPGYTRRHVGVLYRTDRVQASNLGVVSTLSPTLIACDSGLRPGYGGYFRMQGKLDFYLVSVHLDGGNALKNHAHRMAALLGLKPAFEAYQAQKPDTDLLIAGDFNLHGCHDEWKGCIRALSTEDEIKMLDQVLKDLSPPFKRFDSTPRCSAYQEQEPKNLDFFAATLSAVEIQASAETAVQSKNECVKFSCQTKERGQLTTAVFSDHCPLVLGVPNVDMDLVKEAGTLGREKD